MDTFREYLKIKALPSEERQQYINSVFSKVTFKDYFETLAQLIEICMVIAREEKAKSLEYFQRIKREHQIREQTWRKFKARYLKKKTDAIDSQENDGCRVLPLHPKTPENKR